MRRNEILILLFAVFFLVIGAYFYPQLPERMASHWNAQGQVDGYMEKSWGTFFLPAMMAGIALLFLAIPRIDPLKENIEKFRGHYEGFALILMLFMLSVYLQSILWNIGIEISFNATMPIGIGLLFIYMGFLFDRIKKNWFIGIRTPWTLSSERVWESTHRLGAKLFKLAGAIALLGVLFPEFTVWLILVPALGTAAITMAYSYLEFRKEMKPGG